MFNRLKQILAGALLGFLIPTMALGQTATLLPNAVQQYLDASGNPVSSGTVDYYVPNTTTRKTTWSSPTESVGTQNPNPVLLSAGGYPQNGSGAVAGTYGDGSYRQVVKDSSGNTIWDLVTTSTGSSSSGGGSAGVGDGLFVGSIIPYSGVTPPVNYLFADGSAISRTSFSALYTAITIQTNIVCSVGISSISVSTTISNAVPIGTKIETGCFTPGTTVTAKSSGILTMSTPATITSSVPATLFPWGNGDGATTFNVPDLRGRVIAGPDNQGGGGPTGVLTQALYGVNPDAIAAYGGSQSNSLNTANLPPYTPSGAINIVDPGHSHTTSIPTTAGGGTGGTYYTPSASANSVSTTTNATGLNSSNTTFVGSPQGGTSAIFRTIQPSATVNYIIKAKPDAALTVASISQLTPGNPNQLAGTDGTGVWGNVTVPTGLSVVSSALNWNIPALTTQVSPNANNDYLILYNAASNTTQKVSVGTIASAATSGVSSYNGLTGAVGGTNIQTLSYTIANTDCEKTVQLSSASLLTLTLPAVTGFPANCKVKFKNASASRGVKLSGFPAGLASSGILWPNRAGEVQIVNNLWVVTVDPGVWQPTGAMTLNVDNAGSDTNDGLGLGAGALATPQKCLNILRSVVNLSTSANSLQPTCSLTAGQTFDGGVSCTSMGTGAVFFIIGNGGRATIRNTGQGTVIQENDFCGYFILDNLNIDCTNASHPCTAFSIHQQNGADFSTGGFTNGNILTGANAGDIGIGCDAMCRINFSAPLRFAGTFQLGINVFNTSSLNIGAGMTLDPGATISIGLINFSSGSQVVYSGALTLGAGAALGEVFTGRGNGSFVCIGSFSTSGPTPGRQWSLLNGAALSNQSSNAIPGTSPGITSSAGFGNGFVYAATNGGC